VTLVNGALQIVCAVMFGRRWGLTGVAVAGLVAGTLTALPASLYLLRTAGAASIRAVVFEVTVRWLRRASVLIAAAAGVGIFYRTLGVWGTGAIAVLIGLAYVWQMRPLYGILPLDPRWIRWLVSLR